MGDKDTPRKIIREIARASTGSELRRPPQNQAPINERETKRQRGGAGAMSFGQEKETPRRLIAGIAKSSTQSTGTDAKDKKDRRKRQVSSIGSSAKTPKDAHGAIGGFLRVAETDSREKPSPGMPGGDDFEGDLTSDDESAEADGQIDEVEAENDLFGEDSIMQVLGQRKKPGRKAGTVLKKRFENRKSGEIPYLKTTNMFKAFLGDLPRPNRPTASALEEAHASIGVYLDRSIKDFARLARIDGAATHNLTRMRVEQLLRDQGLLNKPLGDEIRRLLDREDADSALGLPLSRARMNRV